MDFQKISSLQGKFNRLKDGLEDSGDEISNMEKKLLVSYLDEIKAVILNVPVKEEALPVYTPPAPVAKAAPAVVAPIVPEPKPVAKAPVVEAPKPPKKEKAKVDQSGISDEIKDLFDEKTPTELSDKIALIRIADLNKSMSINERIFTQKELFNNDLDVFQKTLADLNKLANFGEAKDYLMSNVIVKYDWSNPSKVKKVSNFIKLVRRRFL